MRERRSWYGLLVFLGGASYGFVSPVVKLAYRHGFSAADVTGGQFYFAALLLWILVAISAAATGRRGDSPGVREWPKLALLGFFSALTGLVYYRALDLLPAWLGIVLLFQFAWMVFLFDYVAYRHKPTRGQWVGIVAILGGTLLAVHVGGDFRTFSLVGFAYGLASGVSYAAFLHVNARVSTDSSSLWRSAIITTFGAAAISLVYVPHPSLMADTARGLWLYGGLIGLFSQAIPTTLFSVGIPRVGGSAAAILSSVELPVSVILAALVLGESVGASSWAGVSLILIGIAIGEWSRAKGATRGHGSGERGE